MSLTSISSVLKKALPDDSERRPRKNRKARRAHLQPASDIAEWYVDAACICVARARELYDEHDVRLTDGRALNGVD